MFSKKTRNLAVTVLAFLMAITLGFGVMGFTAKVSAETTTTTYSFDDTSDLDLFTFVSEGSVNNGIADSVPTSSSAAPAQSGKAMYMGSGSTNKTISATTNASFDNITAVSVYLAAGDKAKSFISVEVVDDAGSVVKTLRESSATNQSNNKFFQDSYTVNPAVSGKIRISFYDTGSGSRNLGVDELVITHETSAQGGDTSSSEDTSSSSETTEPEPEIPPVVSDTYEVSFANAKATSSSNYWNSVTNNGYTSYFGRRGANLPTTSDGIALGNSKIIFTFSVKETTKVSMYLVAKNGSDQNNKSVEVRPLTDAEFAGIEAVADQSKAYDIGTNGPSTSGTTITFTVPKTTDTTVDLGTYEEGNYAVYLVNSVNSSVYMNKFIFEPLVKGYAVTFDYDNETAKTTQTVIEGQTAVEPTEIPTKEGYVFHGWHNAETGVHFDFDTPIYANLNLIAIWYDETATEITDFVGATNSQENDATERLLDGTYTVEYIGQTREKVREAAIALLPSEIEVITATGNFKIELNWVHAVREHQNLDTLDPIEGQHVYIAAIDEMPEGYYTTLWLRAIVEVADAREEIDTINDELEFTVAEGTDLNTVLPEYVEVKTVKGNVVNVKVSWSWNEEDVVAGTLMVYGTPEAKYTLKEDGEIVAIITIKGTTVNKEVVETLLTWDAREEEVAILSHDKLGDEYIVAESDKAVVLASSNIENGKQTVDGNSINTLQLQVNNPYLKIVVAVNARISITSGAGGSGNRTFVLSDENGNKLLERTFNSGTTANPTVYYDSNAINTVDVEAGTYYFKNTTSGGSSAQVYKIVIEELAITEDYYFEANETLFEEDMLPVQEGYTFVGWVTPSADAILAGGVAATEEGYYSPLYVKVTMTTSVKIGKDGGIKFAFTAEFINGDSLTDEAVKELVNVTLTVTGNRTAVVENANYVYENGKLISSAVITGWTAETAPTWREVPVKASITLSFNGIEKTFAGEEALSAKDVATRFASEYPELAEQYAEELEMYIG